MSHRRRRVFVVGTLSPRISRNGYSKQHMGADVLHALIALAPSWWPGPRLGQDRVHPVERHQ
jgi:hypothetical protein